MERPPFSLQGETALITGGGTGIGLGIARCFVQAGARVLLTGRRADVLAQAAAELGAAASYLPFDVQRYQEAEAFIEQAQRQVGDISILVNNAGQALRKTAEETSMAEFQTVLDTHLFGAVALTRALIPGMRQRQRGNILFMASMTSYLGLTETIAYAAAKSAYLGVIRTLVAELTQDGIRVNGIAPGWIETPMLKTGYEHDSPRRRKVMSRIAMGYMGQPEDIGWAAVYLCSDAARYVTGVVLPVDGGALVSL